METGINWLKLIYEAIKNLGNSIAGANQSDWNEATTTSAAYIKNKPTVPTVVTVKGTVSDNAFTEDEGEIGALEALEVIKAGGLVYLTYEDAGGSDVYSLVTSASDVELVADVNWEIPAEEAAES